MTSVRWWRKRNYPDYIKSNAERWLNILSNIIVSYAEEWFGLREGKKEKSYRKNCRAKKLHDLRRELRTHKKKSTSRQVKEDAGKIYSESWVAYEVLERKREKENIVPRESLPPH